MGRFLLGFVVGAALGATVVLITTPKSGEAARRSFADTIHVAWDAGRAAATIREQELWNEFHANLKAREQRSATDQSQQFPPPDRPFSE